METHSSILAWEIPWTEEPGGLQPWVRKESDMSEQFRTACFLGKTVSLCAASFSTTKPNLTVTLFFLLTFYFFLPLDFLLLYSNIL